MNRKKDSLQQNQSTSVANNVLTPEKSSDTASQFKDRRQESSVQRRLISVVQKKETSQLVARRDRGVEVDRFKHWRSLNAKNGPESNDQYVTRYELAIAPDTLTPPVRTAILAYQTEKATDEADPFYGLDGLNKEPALAEVTIQNPDHASVSYLDWSRNLMNYWRDGESAADHVRRFTDYLKADKKENLSLAAIGTLTNHHPAKIGANNVIDRFKNWVNTNNIRPQAGSRVDFAFDTYMHTQDHELLTQEGLNKVTGDIRVLNAADTLAEARTWGAPNSTEDIAAYIERFRVNRLDNNQVISAQGITALNDPNNTRSGNFAATTQHPSVTSPTDLSLFPSGVRVSKQINFVPAGDFGVRHGGMAAFNALKARFIAAANNALSNKYSVEITSPGAPQPGDGTYRISVFVNEDNGAPYNVNMIGGQHGTSSAGGAFGTIYELGLPSEHMQSDVTMAHESAHMILGASDEYADASFAARPLFTDHSLMGNYPAEGPHLAEIKARHFGHLVTQIGTWYPGRNVRIV